MKGRVFLAGLFLTFAAELAALGLFVSRQAEQPQNTVAVNEILQTVQRDWDSLEDHVNETGLDYVVLGTDGMVLCRTRPGLSESINAATAHRDTMLDVELNGTPVGKLIVYNDNALTLRMEKQTVLFIAAAMLLQLGICAGYFFYTVPYSGGTLPQTGAVCPARRGRQPGYSSENGSAQSVRSVYREL